MAKSAGTASIKIEHESRQITQGWFIELFFEWTSEFERAPRQDIAESFPELLELLKGDRLLESHRELSSHKAHGMVAVVEAENAAHRRFS